MVMRRRLVYRKKERRSIRSNLSASEGKGGGEKGLAYVFGVRC